MTLTKQVSYTVVHTYTSVLVSLWCSAINHQMDGRLWGFYGSVQSFFVTRGSFLSSILQTSLSETHAETEQLLSLKLLQCKKQKTNGGSYTSIF